MRRFLGRATGSSSCSHAWAFACVRVRGTVFYSDQLQILVKWDDGRSESLRPRVDRFRIVDDE
jgi:hypothetical protein